MAVLQGLCKMSLINHIILVLTASWVSWIISTEQTVGMCNVNSHYSVDIYIRVFLVLKVVSLQLDSVCLKVTARHAGCLNVNAVILTNFHLKLHSISTQSFSIDVNCYVKTLWVNNV